MADDRPDAQAQRQLRGAELRAPGVPQREEHRERGQCEHHAGDDLHHHQGRPVIGSTESPNEEGDGEDHRHRPTEVAAGVYSEAELTEWLGLAHSGAMDEFDELLAHLSKIHPSKYGLLLEGID